MKEYRFFRLSAPVPCLVSMFVYVWVSTRPDICCITAYLLACGVNVSFCPSAGETLKPATVLSIISFILLLVATLFFRGRNISCLQAVLAISSVLLAVFVSASVRQRYSKVLNLFHIDDVWKGVRFVSLLASSALLLFLSLALSIVSQLGRMWISVLLIVMVLFLDILLYARNFTGRSFIMGTEKERQIRETVTGRISGAGGADVADAADFNSLYAKVNEVMNSVKPFLKDKYTEDDLALDVGSNRYYVSQAINVYFGQSFPQFINFRRVLYSLTLIRANPDLKVMELALMCGFRTVPSYSKYFKKHMKVTPQEYLASVRRSSDLSNQSEVGS